MRQSVQKIGDWDKVAAICVGLSDRFAKNIKRATIIVGESIEAAILKHIQEQDINWVGLSKTEDGKPKGYLKMKIEKFGKPNFYILTSSLSQNITSVVRNEATGFGYYGFVGVLRGTTNKDGSSFVDIAYVLEYGSIEKNIPSRPLWRPTFQQMTPEVKRIYEQALNNVLRAGKKV